MDPFTIAVAGASAFEVASNVASRLKVAGDSARKGQKYLTNNSLTDIAQVARVEPIAMVDADVMNVEYLSDVMQSLHSIFAGYYLQAINLVGTIGSISIANKLAPLNPNRGAGGGGLLGLENHKADWRMVTESYKHRLPKKKNPAAMAMEAQNISGQEKSGKEKSGNQIPPVTDKDAITVMREASNLAVGKMFNVTLREGENSAVIPIAIRLMVNTIPTAAMVALFTFKNSFDMDLKERYHSWRAGRLSFFRDLILCRDLIDKHRTAIITDKSNIYAEIVNRENGNRKAGLMNGSPSLATASNLAVLSSATLANIEQKLNGKFSNFRVRQTLFDNTNLMILAVIDKGYSQVTFYHRGVEGSTQVSAKDLRAASKGGGSDVMDIMKAYISGSSPQL